MNLLPVEARGSMLQAAGGMQIRLPAPRDGELTLGARAEDMRLGNLDEAHFQADVFTFELLGDCTMATVMIGHTLVAIKAQKDLRLRSAERIGVCFDPQRLYWFDRATGARIRA
jgi:multiple sugar transport system ATP-binding protein